MLSLSLISLGLTRTQAHGAVTAGFSFQVDTTKDGISGSDQFKLPLIAGQPYDFVINWGDGTEETITTSDATHTFATGGVKTCTIVSYRTFSGWSFNNGGDKLKLMDILSWGALPFGQEAAIGSFYGCGNLTTFTATDAPKFIPGATLSSFFRECASLNASIGHWDTGNVVNMALLFFGATVFNQPIGSWDVSNVTNMLAMFQNTTAFNQSLNDWTTSSLTVTVNMFGGSRYNQPLGNWDMTHVTDASYMFQSNTVFNQDIGAWRWPTTGDVNLDSLFRSATAFNNGGSDSIKDWNTGRVTDTSRTFYGAAAFNQPIGSWDVSNVTKMSSMFEGATIFDQNLGSWDVGNVTLMGTMFKSATAFNNGGSDSINNWDTSKVTSTLSMFQSAVAFNQPIGSWAMGENLYMQYMFDGATIFNQPIGNWDTSKNTSLNFTFRNCQAFNQPIGSWNTGNVTNMANAFEGALLFDQNLGSWDVSKVTTMSSMFRKCYVFDNGGQAMAWNTAACQNFSYTFGECPTFNRDISGWDVTAGTNFNNMFNGCCSLKIDLSNWTVSAVPSGTGTQLSSLLSNADVNIPAGSTNLDNIYTAWAAKAASLPDNKAITIGTGVRYSFAGASGRAALVAKGWTITSDVSNGVTFDDNSGKLRGTYTTDMGTGTRVQFTSSGTLPTGLVTGTDYWTIRLTATTCRYATSLANALAGTAIDYTDAGTGTHAQARYAYKFAASSSSGKLLLTLNGNVGDLSFSGRKVRFVTSDTLPAGLVTGQDYWLNRVTATTYRVCNSAADAVRSLNFINYTDAGIGDHELILQGSSDPGVMDLSALENSNLTELV